MNKKGKYKWMKWYPGAMRAETAYLQCSLETRLVWRETLDFLYDQEPRGYLYNGGEAISPQVLGIAIAVPEKIVVAALTELLRRGVCSETEEDHELGPGIIYSRRMVRDSAKSTEFKEYGELGGNPALLKAKGKAPKEKAATGQERAFSAETEALYAYAVECLDDAGHKTPKTEKQIETAKDALRLMQESDGHTPDEIHAALEFMRSDTGNGDFPGWRAVTQSIAGFRRKYTKIRAASKSGRRAPSIPDGLRANPDQELPI